MKQLVSEDGFTLVEIIVTLFVVSVFLGIVLQTSYATTGQQQQAVSRAAAMNVAQSNIRKFPTSQAVLDVAKTLALHPEEYAPFYCRPGTAWDGSLTIPDTFASQPDTNTLLFPNAPGITLLDNNSENSEDTPESLVNPEQRVAIYTPNGCLENTILSETSVNASTLKVESTVTYGPPANRDTVRMSRYVEL
ncbi:MAG: type II secretion system protein [Candidatus Saccharimonadales bacterium]